jgi:ElaB/YqjD/DUF883 family membrane-anchored ribosome-binding protein
MIASTDSTSKAASVRNSGFVNVPTEDDGSEGRSIAETALQTAKQWVQQHPTAAVTASVMLGLLVGWVVKRRL